jgi:undecaprenyl-diphosphatase
MAEPAESRGLGKGRRFHRQDDVTVTNDIGGVESRPVVQRTASRLRAAVATLTRPPRSRLPRREARALMVWLTAILITLLIVLVVFDSVAITGARNFPRWVRAVFSDFTDTGKSGWFLYPLAAVILLIAMLPSHLPRFARLVFAAIMARAGFLFLAIAVPGLIGTVFKHLIGRARPFVTGVADPYAFTPFSWSAAYASMPSGHTNTAFAALVAVSVLWPRARPFMLIWALLIAVSRIVVSAHHPTDVIVGALLGAVGAILVRDYFATRRVVFGVTQQGAITVFPGPSLKRIKQALRALLAD